MHYTESHIAEVGLEGKELLVWNRAPEKWFRWDCGPSQEMLADNKWLPAKIVFKPNNAILDTKINAY